METLQREYERLRVSLNWLRHRLRLTHDEFADLYQDAWEHVLHRHQTGPAICHLPSFLTGVLVNQWKMRVRSETRRPTAKLDDQAIAPGQPVDEQVSHRDTVRRALMLITEVNHPRQRQVLELRLVLGLSPAEIREALGISDRTYRRLYTRGMARIETAMEAE